MTKGYIDRSLVQNSALACFVLTDFAKKYEDLTAGTEGPSFLKLLLVLPLVWHKETCTFIKGREFSTPLHSVLAEHPTIRTGFRERLAEFSVVASQGINLACATGLLRQTASRGDRELRVAFSTWPRGSKPTELPRDMSNANTRLAAWFKDASTAQLYSELLRI